MTTATARDWLQRVLAITPGQANFMGIGAGDSGGSDASSVMVYELRRAAIAFFEAYGNPAVDADRLGQLAAEAEGKLMGLLTVLRPEPPIDETLVDGLHRLVRDRG